MRITDEMLYAAAEAAERYLDTLPGQTDCTHAFSPAFEEKLQFLLPRRRKKKLWKRIILLAAVALDAIEIKTQKGILSSDKD